MEARLEKLLEHRADYEGTISDLQVEADKARQEIATLNKRVVRCATTSCILSPFLSPVLLLLLLLLLPLLSFILLVSSSSMCVHIVSHVACTLTALPES